MTAATAKKLSEIRWSRSKQRKGVLYQQFVDILRNSDTTMRQMCEASGVTIEAVREWGLRTDARVGNFEAALNVLGYRLTIEPLTADVKQP